MQAIGCGNAAEREEGDSRFWDRTERLVGQTSGRVLVGETPPWLALARPAQLPVPGRWRQWLIVGGRGSGKTRAGAEWVSAMAAGEPPFAETPAMRIGLVAETLADAREVMIDGESGLLSVTGYRRPVFEVSRRRLVFASGAVAQIFSSEDPDALRGYQFDLAWGDELAKWVHGEASFDNLQLALRLGRDPRAIFTTTPRPIPLLKRLMADPSTVTTHMRTVDNAGNLAPGFFAAMTERYGGTRLGRQELDGEILALREDALFDLARIERERCAVPENLGRIVVAVDPPASAHQRSDACGIVAAGRGPDGTIYILADHSRRRAKPHEWARAAIGLYRQWQADRIVAEVNQGGDMVEAVIRAVEPDTPFQAVRASRGKWLRAEPVAALYERGRVRHAGRFPELEDEMADFGPDGLSGGRSPDRLDALVWAVNALAGDGSGPRIREL
ncbi:DNA-packaging protein [Jiella sp. CQZ9-1]|uniref:DNA-packaging protein n=1 Tax=Jiella flava TaxID=2816857 RepID=A0A939FX76_9HYPH|nr:DNA-packaging protein [Jiella flava]